jgi:putative endonuclease
MKSYCVYILSSLSGVLYVGVTNDTQRRVNQHKQELVPGFSTKYNITKLVYYEAFENIRAAIEREKKFKRWGRAKKVWLIELKNPKWTDLSADWPSSDELS